MKKLALGILAAVMIFAASSSTRASAVTHNTAYDTAYNLIYNHCSDTWHSCETHVTYLYCSGPYGGNVQWWCNGGQMRLYLGLFAECWWYKVGVGPYGNVATWSRGKC